jgi:hypothetical protein
MFHIIPTINTYYFPTKHGLLNTQRPVRCVAEYWVQFKPNAAIVLLPSWAFPFCVFLM